MYDTRMVMGTLKGFKEPFERSNFNNEELSGESS